MERLDIAMNQIDRIWAQCHAQAHGAEMQMAGNRTRYFWATLRPAIRRTKAFEGRKWAQSIEGDKL